MSEKPKEMHNERHLWYKGANYAADAVVLNIESSHVLLIRRKNTGDWALPGGFIDEDDSSTGSAAIREVAEETGLTITSSGTLIYQGGVDDLRNSDFAWIETSAYLFVANEDAPIRAGDDALAAAWCRVDELPELYGSHRQIVGVALGRDE